MSDQKIRVATSIPSLKNKLQTNLSGPTDVIYWYIRFNIPLDDTSVSEKTMDVTDTEGYIMRTDISYSKENHVIVISPLDTYEQNRFYLLNITKKVRSARGQNLRSDIHVLFKLLDNQISDYKVLKKDAKIPKPKPRPRDYDKRQKAASAPNVIDQEYIDRSPKDQMATVNFYINVWVGLAGLILAIVSMVINIIWLLLASAVVCIAGLVHIYIQMKRSELASTLAFNKGVRLFNAHRYRQAEAAFQKSLQVNPDNELAKYGLYKVSLYL